MVYYELNLQNLGCKVLLLLILQCVSITNLLSQNVIKELKLEDYYDDNGIYPFNYHVGNMDIIYKSHNPILKLSENDFVHIWRPKEFNSRIRGISRYNLLLEESWYSEIELRDEEEIVRVFQKDTTIVLLNVDYDNKLKEHKILTRLIGIKSGELLETNILSVVKGDRDFNLFLEFSPNDSLFTIYHYGNTHSNKRVRYFYDYQEGEEELGVRAERVEYVVIDVYCMELERKYKDTMYISENPKNKVDVLCGRLDDTGNFYIGTITKNQDFVMYQFHGKSKDTQSLRVRDFPRYWRESDLYNAHFPPLVGKGERIYLAYCDRDKSKGVGMNINMYQIVAFDFRNREVDMKRRINIDSSILVEVSKKREEAGLKPITKFDKYLIHSMIETPDQGLMLIVQKFSQENRLSVGSYRSISLFSPIAQGTATTILEEIIIFEFDPFGRYKNIMVVPSYQRVKVAIEMLGYFFNLFPDWEDQTFHFLVHENGGEKYGEPLRLFYKTLDLTTGKVSERIQIFEHKRRNHYYSRPHTIWLNDQVVATLMHVNTSISTQSFWVTYSIE